MYSQIMYRDVEVGGVYHCPPGGMIYACVKHDRGERSIAWLVLVEGSINIPAGTLHLVQYCDLDSASWTRIA